jgi:hypothetical protein
MAELLLVFSPQQPDSPEIGTAEALPTFVAAAQQPGYVLL